VRAPLLLAAMLLLATAPLALAADRCTPAQGDRFESLPGLPGLPAGWLPLLALDESRLPPVPSVAASGPGGVCALTQDVGAFARAAGVRSPEALASLAIAAAFPDQFGIPEVRSLRIADGIAHAETWSPKDGVVADWIVDLATLRADFVVRAVGIGPYEAEVEGWHVWPGLTSQQVRDLENGALATKVRMVPLPDGKAFRLTYFTQFYSSEAQADQYAQDYADASLAIWTIQNQQWGFASGDTDGVYDIKMDGCSCISGGFNVNIRVHAKLEDLITLLNLQYPTNQHFYRVVIGHEWHHHLQYTINQWALGNYLTEGAARFSETIFEPEGAFGPKTIQTLPNANGFANMLLTTNVAPTGRTYDFGLFWGYMYAHNGGIPFLKKLYQESKLGGDLYAVVDRTLAAMADPEHATFNEAWAAFAVALYEGNFVWGLADGSQPRDWGTYLPKVRMEAMNHPAPGVAIAEGDAVLRGIRFYRVPTTSDLVATSYGGDGALLARWVWDTPSGTMVRPAGAAYLIQDGPIGDPALVIVRGPTVPNDLGQRAFGAGKFKAVVGAPHDTLGL
jgi:hypothetical protein